MFVPGWIMWCVLLTLHMSAHGLDISGYDSNEVICSQGLSDCTMEDGVFLTMTESKGVDVRNLTPYFKLCCKDTAPCTLCLVIDAEITIKDMEEEGHSGSNEEDYSEENPKASVAVCFSAVPSSIPTCKKVGFTINHTALAQPNQAKFSMVITEPPGVSYSSHVTVHSSKPSLLSREAVVPSLDEVCSLELQERVEECRVPTLSSVINTEMNQVELQFDRNESLPSVCIQYEENGRCQKWSRTTIPLDSVTPCMCLQVWDEDDQRPRRSLSCPFTNTDFLQRNVWQNVSVSVSQRQMINHHMMLLWNLSAPCRLEGEVWPCVKDSSCREMKGFRQQLANDSWRQNSKGLWENMGVFKDINLQLSPCVMVKVKGMGRELGPFCFNNTDRHRWSLLLVGVMLLVCSTVLVVYLLHDFVKKCVGHCRYVGREGHVVLLSPPDVDDGVSESVCRLGSQLRTQGFSVSVDQWSRKEQCDLGPLPWLHSQLLELNSRGGRVVLALTPKALKKVEEWTRLSKDAIKRKGEDEGLPQICSPYSDVFTASLCLIAANKQLGRANERFLLVKFDSHHISDESLPELLQGLPLFKFPSKTQALLSALTAGGTERASGKRTWTGWKWSGSDGWRARTKEEQNQQKDSYVGDEKYSETKPLKCP